jgi:hypothetical protein
MNDAARSAAEIVYKKIAIYIPSPSMFSRDKATPAQMAKMALVDVCRSAYKLSMIFGSSKAQYLWTQRNSVYVEKFLDPTHMEILGSAGMKSYVPGPRQYKIVFGGVVKGGGTHGLLSDEVVYLTETALLLGPFDT